MACAGRSRVVRTVLRTYDYDLSRVFRWWSLYTGDIAHPGLLWFYGILHPWVHGRVILVLWCSSIAHLVCPINVLRPLQHWRKIYLLKSSYSVRLAENSSRAQTATIAHYPPGYRPQARFHRPAENSMSHNLNSYDEKKVNFIIRTHRGKIFPVATRAKTPVLHAKVRVTRRQCHCGVQGTSVLRVDR